MKKRLLSLVLCLVMVFSLLPMGSLAIERPAEQYVSAGTNWKTTTNYQSAAEQGNDDTLYYKDGDNYYPVSWQTGQNLYTISGTTSTNWTPRAVASGTYYYNVNSDKLTFSQVSTKPGDLYYASTVEFKDSTSDDMKLHTDWWYWNTQWFIKANDVTAPGGYSRLMLVNYGATSRYKAWAYYWRDGRYNSTAGQMSHKWTASRGVTTYDRPNNDYYNSNYCTEVTIDGSIGYTYTWVASDKHFGLQTYLRTTGANSIWYNNGSTQLGSTVYDTDASNTNSNQTAWSGALYTKNSTGTTTLTNKDTGATISGVSPSAINGDVIYAGDLYVKKYEALPSPEPTTIITTEETGDDGVYTSKELTANGDAYDVTLTAYTTGNEVKTSSETITPTVKPMDIVMVVDQSGSMATRDMGNSFTAAATPSGGWTVDAATSGKQYYYSPDGGANYYPVHASTGYVYEKADSNPRASDLLNNGDDAISLGVNGAPTYYNIKTDYYVMYNGELHRLYLITAGLFLNYGLYPYIYTDNNDAFTTKDRWEGHNYWVAVFDPWDGSDLRDNGTWDSLTSKGAASSRVSFVNTNGEAIGSTDKNADSARLSYSWFTSSAKINNLYKLSDTKVANQLYYVDSAGNRQNIGTTAQYAGDVVYTGTLYEGNSESRVDALKAAVTEFANTVQANAQNFGVDHRMALVGFAGNKVPAYSLGADATTVGSNGLADYTNTGLFFNGGFENYEKITGYNRTTDQYINRHYYQSASGSYVPVKYSDGWQRLNLTTGATTNTSYSSSNWYKATYEGNGTSLSAADYRAALVSVNNNDALNSNISTAISQFAANGGTYTSYGMTMAEQLYKAVEDAHDTTGVDSEGQTVERQRVIIVFTDGEPGANGYDASIAGEALVSGNLAKTEQDAIVYTVGLFKSAPSSQVADFMKKLSSEYEMTLTPVYGGADNDNYSLGSLNPNKTYYYKNETTGKYYAVTTEYGTGSSLGWWIYNGSHSGSTESYSLTNPRRSTGAGTTVFYNANGSSVNGEDVVTGRTYYTSDGDKIVYEYRWFDSDRSIKNPALQSGQSTSAGEARVQFYDLAGTVANDDGLSYYMTASNAAELNNVFAQIAGTIVSEEITVENGSAYTEDTMYVMDEISADFDLPADLSAANNHVTVYADTVASWNDDGSPKTYNESTTPLRQGDAAAIEAGNADVEVVWNGKKVQINYFDFGRMYMQDSNPNAARIRVVIDGVTPNKAGEKLYSNTAQSGLYYKDPESGAVTMVEAFNRPYISVPGYTVKWVDDQGTNMDNPYDQDVDLIKGNVPVYDGSEPTKASNVVENVSRTDYTFDGWSTTPGGDKVISITRDAETGTVTSYGTFPAVVDSDVTYYAHFASEVKNFYTATWFNGTTQLFEQKGLANGDVPEYGGTIPAKNADDVYTYFFAGWYDEAAHTRNGETYVAADVITQLPAINGANVNYYAVFAPVQIETRNIVMEYNTKTLIQGETVTGFDAMYTPGGDFSLEKAENAASGNFFFTPGTQRNTQYQPAEAGKYVFDVTGFSVVNTAAYYEGDKPTKVNVIPAAGIYFDDSLLSKEADLKKTDKSGNYKDEYRVDQTDIPAVTADQDMAAGKYDITFTGTGIDIYCTTHTQGGFVQAKCEGQMQTVKNYDSKDTRYNVPSISFTGLDYGTHTVTIQVLSSSNYKLDGIRVYGAMNDQSAYAGTHEQYAAFINMREALVNDTGVSQAFSDSMDNAVLGALFVDDSSKLKQYVTASEQEISDGKIDLFYKNDEGKFVKVTENTPEDAVLYKSAYESEFAAYKSNSPKHEIYLSNNQAIVFQLSADAVTAAANGNLWIGLSAPDAGVNTGTVTLKEGKTISVTSAVDMYYPITSDMIGADGVVTLTNTGDNMISVTNLKITGNQVIYNAANASKAAPASVNDGASALAVEDAIDLVFEPVTMKTVKVAANNGVDPDAPATPDTPDEPDDPTPTHVPSLSELVRQIFSNFVSSLFQSIARLFNH